MSTIKTTERGWAGHFICSDRCLFRRNTLVSNGVTEIVVSTVGLMMDIHAPGWPNSRRFDRVGLDRYYETMCFRAHPNDTRYKDIDVEQQISINSNWCLDVIDADDLANNMHDDVVEEIKQRIESGDLV